MGDHEYYGRCAFEAYRTIHNQHSDGEFIEEWESLPESEQRAWVAAGHEAVNAFKGE